MGDSNTNFTINQFYKDNDGKALPAKCWHASLICSYSAVWVYGLHRTAAIYSPEPSTSAVLQLGGQYLMRLAPARVRDWVFTRRLEQNRFKSTNMSPWFCPNQVTIWVVYSSEKNFFMRFLPKLRPAKAGLFLPKLKQACNWGIGNQLVSALLPRWNPWQWDTLDKLLGWIRISLLQIRTYGCNTLLIGVRH